MNSEKPIAVQNSDIKIVYPYSKQPYYKLYYKNELVFLTKYRDKLEKFYEFLEKNIGKEKKNEL